MNRILEQEETLIKSKSEKMRHFRNKLYIALFLVKNPNLRKYRKNYKSNKEYFEEKNRALTPIEFLEKNKKNSVFKPSEPVISLSEISDEEITNNYHNFEVRQKNPFRNKKLAK